MAGTSSGNRTTCSILPGVKISSANVVDGDKDLDWHLSILLVVLGHQCECLVATYEAGLRPLSVNVAVAAFDRISFGSCGLESIKATCAGTSRWSTGWIQSPSSLSQEIQLQASQSSNRSDTT